MRRAFRLNMRTRVTTGPSCPILTCGDQDWLTPSPIPYGISDGWSSLAPSGVNWLVPNGFSSRLESITDDTGTDGRFRDCLHSVETNQFSAPLCRVLFPNAGRSNAYILGYTKSEFDAALALTTSPTIDMKAMAEIALAYMVPHINEGSSLLNYILELKDLKSWARAGTAVARIKGKYLDAKGMTRNRGSASKGLQDVPYNDPRYKRPGGVLAMSKDIAKRLTGAHLEASFGIVPLIGDAVSMAVSLDNLSRKIEAIKRYSSKPQVRHFRRVLPTSGGLPEDTSWKSLAPLQRSWPTPFRTNSAGTSNRPTVLLERRARWIKRPVYHATMRYIYTVPSMGETEERIATLLDNLGVRLDPSIVWNAIPYTFLVDWVVDVSGFLQSFARDNFPIQTTVTDFCHSLAYHSECECSALVTSNSIGNYSPPGNWWGITPPIARAGIYYGTRNYYNRVRTVPDIHSITTKRLKLKQIALSGSLLMNKLLGGTHRTRTSA
jgi:hypothetical protein